MKKQELMIRKVNVQNLIDQLTDLYDRGIDFIDISKGRGDSSIMSISFCKEYMDEDFQEDFENMWEEGADEPSENSAEIIPFKLTDDNINQLL